jgi:hypothetical protein
MNSSLVSDLRDTVDGVDGFLPVISTNGQVVYGANDMSVSVYGVESDYLTVSDVLVEYGSDISQSNIDNLDRVALI